MSYRIILVLIVAMIAEITVGKPSLSISIWHSPIVLGSNIKLTCSVREVDICKPITTRSWYRGLNNDLLLYNGFQRENQSKYKEEQTETCDSFSLNIFNLTEHDINMDYKCEVTIETSKVSAQHRLELTNVSVSIKKNDYIHGYNRLIMTCNVKGIFMCTNDSRRIWYVMNDGRQEYIKPNGMSVLASENYKQLHTYDCEVFSLEIIIDFDVFENTEIGCTFSPDGIVFATHKTVLWGNKDYHIWCVYAGAVLTIMAWIVNKYYLVYFYFKFKIRHISSIICWYASKTFISMVIFGMITSLLLKVNTTTVDVPLRKNVRISEYHWATAFSIIADFIMTYLCIIHTVVVEFNHTVTFGKGGILIAKYTYISLIIACAYLVFVRLNDYRIIVLLNEEIMIFLYSLLFFMSSCMWCHIVHSLPKNDSSILNDGLWLLFDILNVEYENEYKESATQNSMPTALENSGDITNTTVFEMDEASSSKSAKNVCSKDTNNFQQSYLSIPVDVHKYAVQPTENISENERDSLILDSDSSCYSTASEGLSVTDAFNWDQSF